MMDECSMVAFPVAKGNAMEQFECEGCGEAFESEEGSRAEAVAEGRRIFPTMTADEQCIVCDDCYAGIMAMLAANQ